MTQSTPGGMEPSSSIDLNAVNKAMRILSSTELNDEAQEQLGRIQSIINCYIGPLKQAHVDSLFIAVTALSGSKPNVLLAQSIL